MVVNVEADYDSVLEGTTDGVSDEEKIALLNGNNLLSIKWTAYPSFSLVTKCRQFFYQPKQFIRHMYHYSV